MMNETRYRASGATHSSGADTRSVAMKVVTADNRPDGTAATSSHRPRRRQSTVEATDAGAARGAEKAPTGETIATSPGTGVTRARSAGIARDAATASRTTSSP
jgi:hypothetical protein